MLYLMLDTVKSPETEIPITIVLDSEFDALGFDIIIKIIRKDELFLLVLHNVALQVIFLLYFMYSNILYLALAEIFISMHYQAIPKQCLKCFQKV